MVRRGRDRLVWDLSSKHPVNEVDLEVAQRRLQRHAIATVGARREADDEDAFKLQQGLLENVQPYYDGLYS